MTLLVENIKFTYDNSEFAFLQTPLLSDVSFVIEPGSVLHVIGANGSGKTTLLKIIADILAANYGDIKYQNKSILQQKIRYKEQICYVGHKLGINLQLSVLENCYYDLKNSKSMLEISEILHDFNLHSLRDEPCGQLSAGQKKRVSLLRLLLSPSKLWILDEPFTALDKEFVNTFVKYMQLHIEDSGMIIYTSHQSINFPGCNHTEYNL